MKFLDSDGLNKRIGANIRFKRKQFEMSVGELAREVGITDAFMGLIERGERGTSLVNLVFLSEFFSVPLDKLILYDLEEEKLAEEDENVAEAYSNLAHMIKGLSEEECKFLISVIREMKKLTI